MASQEIAVASFDDLKTNVATAAQRLLGCILERDIGDQTLRVRIVETEAYDQTDVASHSYNGPAGRAASMFRAAGHSYIYMSYGMHFCCNIVVGQADYGAGALIRAAEPLSGDEVMSLNRGGKSGALLTNGPGKLCQALQIDRTLDGHDLHTSPLRLIMQPPLPPDAITTTTRIGISKATDVLWRFYITDNAYVSARAVKGVR